MLSFQSLRVVAEGSFQWDNGGDHRNNGASGGGNDAVE